jgi:hypothetical protein
MDPKKKPWQPRIDKDPEFNPSVSTTEPSEDDEPTLEDIEAESEESEAREDDPEPIKTPHRTP